MDAVVTTSLNPLKLLSEQGQSVWLDYFRRDLMSSGELDRLIEQDGLNGLTSNPTIFEKAIADGSDYRDALDALRNRPDLDAVAVFESLAVADIRRAADQFAPTYRATRKRDGYVSLEVSPRLASDTRSTVAEARRLWQEIDRPNVLIKVPATPAGLTAFEALLSEGINVNVTLLFSLDVYAKVTEAYLRALETRAGAAADLSGITSVASFFVSRVDSAVDKLITQRLANHVGVDAAALLSLQGRVAIANAKVAYQHYQSVFSGTRWQDLTRIGARTQRLLWASTSTKSPAYRDVRYVEELIGQDTATTLPPATLNAFREHGKVRASLSEAVADAEQVLAALPDCGIDLGKVTERLLAEGVDGFYRAYAQVLETITRVRSRNDGRRYLLRLDLPPDLQRTSDAIVEDWAANHAVRRLWNRDKTLWTATDEDRWLDWLDIATTQLDHLGDLRRPMHLAEGRYFKHAVLLGMGGSSLAAELFAQTFGHRQGHPELLILDSTDPDQIRAVERRIDMARAAFVVASRSGSTLEPNLLLDYFFARASDVIDERRAADHFGVITDPGSTLEYRAREKGLRNVFHGRAGIGGRYSALSDFGMVPAAVMGVDVGRLLSRAQSLAKACSDRVPVEDNPGLQLGAVLAAAWRTGRDKVTLFCSPRIGALGAWIEQLLAESTGKQGKALIPVVGEKIGHPRQYAADRLLIYLRLATHPDHGQDEAFEALRAAGQAVVQIDLGDIHDLGGELFRWEFATALTGSVMGINPFDRPDVESAKLAARDLIAVYERSGRLPRPEPCLRDERLSLFLPEAYGRRLAAQRDERAVATLLKAHFNQLRPGDYFALIAYVSRLDEAFHTQLQRLRHALRDRYRAVSCLDYGPRYLHSTGQAYKGGPNTGVFLMITRDLEDDVAVPGYRSSFGVVEAAQAEGDFRALADNGRRVLRIHLLGDRLNALIALESLIQTTLTH